MWMAHGHLLLLVLSGLSLVSAVSLSKERLCGEICWTYYNNDSKCPSECIKSPTPTDDEAALCQTCISDCVSKFIGGIDFSRYGTCRKNCFNQYFGPFMGSYPPKKKTLGRRDYAEMSMVSLTVYFTDPDEYIPSRDRVCTDLCAEPVLGSSPPSNPEETKPIGVEETKKKADQRECVGDCIENPSYEVMNLQLALLCTDHCDPDPNEAIDDAVLQACVSSCLYEVVVEPLKELLKDSSAMTEASSAFPTFAAEESNALSDFGFPSPSPLCKQNEPCASDQPSAIAESRSNEKPTGSQAPSERSSPGMATMIANKQVAASSAESIDATNAAESSRYSPSLLFFYSMALGMIGLPIL
ncbi:hypothetical protein RUND412_007606 [Rhizina undulata]